MRMVVGPGKPNAGRRIGDGVGRRKRRRVKLVDALAIHGVESARKSLIVPPHGATERAVGGELEGDAEEQRGSRAYGGQEVVRLVETEGESGHSPPALRTVRDG